MRRKQLIPVYHYDNIHQAEWNGPCENGILVINGELKCSELPAESIAGSIRAPRPYYYYESKIYLVKHRKGILASSHWHWKEADFMQLKKHRDEHGKVALNKEHLSETKWYKDLLRLALLNDFPYEHLGLYFSTQGKLISIETEKEHVKRDLASSEKAHLLLQDFLRQPPRISALLTLLYQAKASHNLQQCTKFYVGNDREALETTPNDILIRLHETFKKPYLLHHEFEGKLDQLTTRFRSSPLTKEKKKVIANFKHFYAENHANPSMMPRATLLEEWIKAYIGQYAVHPFTILSQQRRRGVFKLFNPAEPKSIQLFRAYLGLEPVPEIFYSTSIHSGPTQPRLTRV